MSVMLPYTLETESNIYSCGLNVGLFIKQEVQNGCGAHSAHM